MNIRRRVVLVAFDGVQILDLGSPAGAFDAANRLGDAPLYEIIVATLSGAPAVTSAGIPFGAAQKLSLVAGNIDTVLVIGGVGADAAAQDHRLLTQLRRLAGRSRRVASVCTGATVLAAAGLLDGRRATTHWRYADRLAAAYPAVTVDPGPLYIKDGRTYTSAGVTSALDLSLALIEEDAGPTLARQVARELVAYLHRRPDQAQLSMFLTGPAPENRVVRDLAGYIAARPAADLTPKALAARAGVSARHLSRLFRARFERTPTDYVRVARAEAAVQLLTTTDLPIASVAQRCGFGSTETLRQAVLHRYGIPPSRLRKQATGRDSQERGHCPPARSTS